jgi:hypothetical protein
MYLKFCLSYLKLNRKPIISMMKNKKGENGGKKSHALGKRKKRKGRRVLRVDARCTIGLRVDARCTVVCNNCCVGVDRLSVCGGGAER